MWTGLLPSFLTWASFALVFLLVAAPAPAADRMGPRAHETVREIAALGPRPAGSVTERKAARLIRQKLAALGYRTKIQRVPLPNGGASRNVVASSGGPVDVIVMAHLDGVAAGPAANDNASGVAVVIELARALSGRQGVMFAAVGAEERVETGSRVHLGSARLVNSFNAVQRARLRLTLSLDMVGFGTQLHARGIEPAPNSSAQQALQSARNLGIRMTYRQDSGVSDHAEFTRAGVPASWIQWRWDTCWHTACDTASRVKPWKLGASARVALKTVRDALRR